MRKLSITLAILGIAGLLFVAFVPFMVMSLPDEKFGIEEGHIWIYFNGRIKIVELLPGENVTTNTDSSYWDFTGVKYGQHILALIVAGSCLFLVGGAYKVINPMREDRRISAALMLFGGVVGLGGTLLIMTFVNNLANYFVLDTILYYYGFYGALGIFGLYVLVGIVLLIQGFIKPFREFVDDDPLGIL
ncbi:MAG: hypothetical protein KGD59_11325 [Candidatus Heimdallarchaeota archaeon]|nr:hypothetical protein [Candidatus Heimdallarchaeota archaeon]MBY8995133.1 hypothetical protein [Candidatus Heimdallarchaeota archaeon]